MNLLTLISVGCGFALLPMLTHAPQDPAAQKINHYIGASMCKSCHNDAAKGGTYDHWAKTKHAKAFETLATPAAKAIGKKLGIADPQKSENCLKCHVTAYGLDAKELGAKFKPADGVQCESCHGPGEAHKTKRFNEAMKEGKAASPITADEIRVSRSIDTCNKCHNEESPSYKPFCLAERMKDIEHLDPRKKRSDEDLAKLRATDAPDCKSAKGAKKEGEEKKDEKK